MSFAWTTINIEEPFGPALVGHNLPIRWVVEARDASTGAWAAKDISAARYTYELRLFASDDDSAVIDREVITKGSATGELAHDYPCGTTVRDDVLWQVVEIDNNVASADSLSGQVEAPLKRWRQPIVDTPLSE